VILSLHRIHPLGCAGVGLACLSLLASGCGRGGVTGGGSEAKAHILRLAILYGRYAGSHRGQSPPNEKAFKDWIRKADPAELPQDFDRSNVDSLFISPRDNEPYVIVYGVPATMPVPGKGGTASIYEKTGVAGKHLVAIGAGQVDEVDDAKLQQMLPSGAH
jgi:hypothetical protein